MTELKKINQFVAECTRITTFDSAFIYGINANGNSIKIAVTDIMTPDYGSDIDSLQGDVSDIKGQIRNILSTLNSKSNVGHRHAISDVDGLQTALDAKSDVGHQHTISDVDGLQNALDAITQSVEDLDVTALDRRVTANTDNITTLTSQQTQLNDSVADMSTEIQQMQRVDVDLASSINSNAEAISQLQTDLGDKSDKGHTHNISDVEDLENTLQGHDDRLTALEERGSGVDGALLQRDLELYTGTVGEIVQHTGADSVNFTDGYIYRCTVSTQQTWERVDVQPDTTNFWNEF